MNIQVKELDLEVTGLAWEQIIGSPGIYAINSHQYINERIIVPDEGTPLFAGNRRLCQVPDINQWHRFTFIRTNESISIG